MRASGLGRVVPKEEESPSGGYVLVVGEDPIFLDYYRQIFQNLGFIPLTVQSYEGALACLRLLVFDFVVVDQGGKGFEGRCILDRVKELEQRASVLIVTRCPDEGCCLKAIELGAVDYLPDPVTITDIARMVRSMPGCADVLSEAAVSPGN